MTTPSSSGDDVDERTRRRVVASVVLIVFLASASQIAIAPALLTIGNAFGETDQLPWVFTAYFLSSTMALPLCGRLSDKFGRRIMIAASVFLFALGSMLCALSPNLLWLAISRGIQGLGGGVLVPLAQTTVADVVPPHLRGRYQAYFSVIHLTASLSGPLLGGFAVQYLDWTVIFWLNLPLCAGAWLICDYSLRSVPRRRHAIKIDIIGAGLLASATLMLMLALSPKGAGFSNSPLIVMGLIAAAAAIGSVYFLHSRIAADPLLPIRVLKNRVAMLVIAGGFFNHAALVGLEIYMPSYFQIVLGVDPARSGLVLTPMTFAATTSSVLLARMYGRGIWTKWVHLSLLTVSAGAIFVFALIAVESTPLIAATLLCVATFGIGMGYPLTTLSIQNSVEQRDLGVATATSYFIRSLGSASSSAVLGTILLANSAGRLPGEKSPAIAASSFELLLYTVAFFTLTGLFLFLFLSYKPAPR